MRFLLGGVTSVITVSIAMAGACLFTAGPASAQSVKTGTFSFTSDAGDWVGGGQSYSYDTTAGDTMGVTGSSNDGGVNLSVDGANGDWWYLDLAAPTGKTLAPGTYTGGTRFGGPDAPAIDFSGNGRGCNQTTGSFTINTIKWGPNGYVEALDAAFEQHCEGGDAASRGQVRITNPPAPPALDLGLTVATDGTADTLNGNATLHGSVTCTKAANVFVNGTIIENNKGFIAKGTYSKQVPCTPDGPVAWTVTVAPSGDVAFKKGDAQATSQASGFDTDYGKNVTVSDITVVTLTKSKV
jgi:hypothetical protein